MTDVIVNGVEHRKRKRSPSTMAQESHREKRMSVGTSKETPEQIQFKEFVSQLESILATLYNIGIALMVVGILRLVF